MGAWLRRLSQLPTHPPLRPAAVTGALVLTAALACGGDQSTQQPGSGRIADVASTVAVASGVQAQGAPLTAAQGGASAVQSLARAAGGSDGTHYTVRRSAVDQTASDGTIVGRIGGGDQASRDSIVRPTHDLSACTPFTQRAVPTLGGGVGNAVVWLVGVATGPADTGSRRTALRLAGCRLEPHVQRVPVGGTLMLASQDAMMSRLQFADVVGVGAGPGPVRATVLFNDAGQIVPTSDATVRPGIVEVRDDLHPWVRAFVAVAPHPFVAVTGADGQFRFDSVPSGRYTLVVWSEVLGTRTRELTVTSGVETRIDVKY